MSEQPVGFIESPWSDHGVLWNPCYDPQKLLQADPKRVLYLTSQEQVYQELLSRYPNLEPDLGRVHLGCNTNVQVFHEPTVNGRGRDLAKLAGYAKKYGKIVHYALYVFKPHELHELDCVVQDDELRYEPELARKKRLKQKQREQARPVHTDDLYRLYVGLLQLLPKFGSGQGQEQSPLSYVRRLLSPNNITSFHFQILNILGLLVILESLLGKARLRKCPEIREFLQLWDRNRAKNEAKTQHAEQIQELITRLRELQPGRRKKPPG